MFASLWKVEKNNGKAGSNKQTTNQKGKTKLLHHHIYAVVECQTPLFYGIIMYNNAVLLK